MYSDVVIIRVPIDDATQRFFEKRHDALNDEKQMLILSEDSSTVSDRVKGKAFGFPFLKNTARHPADVSIWGESQRDQFFDEDYRNDDGALNMAFGFLSDETTMNGMSGGGVFTNDGEFAGLVFGRIPNTAGVMIPARFVNDQLKLAKIKKNNINYEAFKKRNESVFNAAIEKQLSSDNVKSEMTWSSFSTWALAFQDGKHIQEAFDAFQEVRVSSEALMVSPSETSEFVIYVDEESGASEGERRPANLKSLTSKGYRLYLNGSKWTPNAGGHWEMNTSITNLLEIRKSKPGSDAKINDFFGNFHNLEFRLSPKDGVRSLLIKRSLPGIFDGYSVYLTLGGFGKKKKLNHETELRLSIDKLKEQISKAKLGPFNFSVNTPIDSSYAKLHFEFTDLGSTKFSIRSPYELRCDLPISVEISDAVIRKFGTKIVLPRTKVDLVIRIVIQIIQQSNGTLGVQARATSAVSKSDLSIEILKFHSAAKETEAVDAKEKKSSGIEIEISNILAQAAAAHLNRKIFKKLNSNLTFRELANRLGEAGVVIPKCEHAKFVESKDGIFLTVGFGKQLDPNDESESLKSNDGHAIAINGRYAVKFREPNLQIEEVSCKGIGFLDLKDLSVSTIARGYKIGGKIKFEVPDFNIKRNKAGKSETYIHSSRLVGSLGFEESLLELAFDKSTRIIVTPDAEEDDDPLSLPRLKIDLKFEIGPQVEAWLSDIFFAEE